MAVSMKNAVFCDLYRVALVTADVLEERSTFVIRVMRIGELGIPLEVTSNRCTL
jgi:hypothetical protein